LNGTNPGEIDMNETTKGICYTAESNARFAALPPNKQRAAIALDGLKLLAARKLVAVRGRYVQNVPRRVQDALYKSESNGHSFQDTIANSDMDGCQVCAKGLIFLCTIARRNQVTDRQASDFIGFSSGSAWTGAKMASTLGNVFAAEQLRLMEVEFENQDFEYVNGHAPNHVRAVMQLSWLSTNDRLVAILRNIVDNDGEFKPVPPTVQTLEAYHNRQLPAWKAPRSLTPRREKVIVTVTATHIAKGDVDEPTRHPVALALHKAGLRRWTVGGANFYVGKSLKPVDFPASVKQFVKLYDDSDLRELAKPFSFEVAVA